MAAHSSIVDAFEITDTFGDIDAAYDIENIRGSVFSDTIIGNSGNNRLRGGLSADVMSGGAGNDVFVFAAGENDAADTITDFSLLDDALDLAGLLDAAFTPGARERLRSGQHVGQRHGGIGGFRWRGQRRQFRRRGAAVGNFRGQCHLRVR